MRIDSNHNRLFLKDQTQKENKTKETNTKNLTTTIATNKRHCCKDATSLTIHC